MIVIFPNNVHEILTEKHQTRFRDPVREEPNTIRSYKDISSKSEHGTYLFMFESDHTMSRS